MIQGRESLDCTQAISPVNFLQVSSKMAEIEMEIAQTPGSGATRILRQIWPRKDSPIQQAQEPLDRMLEDLARLAELSPHLLRDIGFAPDPGSSSPARDVWRKKGLCIAVVRQDTGAAVRIERLTD